MKIGVYWATPAHLDPNKYLRSSILNASDEENTLVEIDQKLKISKITTSSFDAILVIGTLLKPELYLVDFLHEKKDIPVFFWDLESPYDADFNTLWYPYFDHVFCVEESMYIETTNVPISYLPLAVDPLHFYLKPRIDAQPQVAIVGSDYENRKSLTSQFESLLVRPERILRVGGTIASSTDLISQFQRLSTREISKLDNTSRICIISGRDFDYANSLRSINAGSPGPRIFESIMSGGLPLVDALTLDKSICKSLFPDLLFFTNVQEAIDLFRSISDSERLARVIDLQEIVFTKNLYKHRVAEISKKIQV
jgi:hypothetical protein